MEYQIISFPILVTGTDKYENQTVMVLNCKPIEIATYYQLLKTNGKIYHSTRDNSSFNVTDIMLLPIEEQIDAFNKHFYKFINPPVHLEKHLEKVKAEQQEEKK